MDSIADKARKELLERERRQFAETIRAFENIKTRLQTKIDEITAAIDAARAAGLEVTPGRIFERNRLKGLLDQATDEVLTLSKKLAASTEKGQTAAIEIAKRQTIQTPAITGDYSFFDSDAAKKIIGIAGDGAPLDKVFARLALPVRQSIFDALFFGVATGQSNPQIAKAIKDAVGKGAVNAMTIARTETNRAYREVSREFYESTPGVIGWRWQSALDLHTCPVCWAMHGKIFKTKTKFGTHPNCRCTMIPVFKNEAAKETGENKFKTLTPAQQLTILGAKKFELYGQGAALRHFVETYQSPFGLSRRIRPLDRIKFVPNAA